MAGLSETETQLDLNISQNAISIWIFNRQPFTAQNIKLQSAN